MEREGVPNYLGEHDEEEEEADVDVAPERRRVERPHAADGQLFLDAGRVLMLWGWGALLSAVSTPARGRPDTSSAVHALLGLVLWFAGVSLGVVAIVPVTPRFPVARIGAAVASAVTGCFFPPRN